MAATLPFPAAASDLNSFMTVKLLLNEVVEMLDGTVVRREAEAPPLTAADQRRRHREGEPPEHANPAETHIVSFGPGSSG